MNEGIVVDEPVDLPDGAADSMTAEEQSEVDRALERSLAQADAGERVEADEVLAERDQRS